MADTFTKEKRSQIMRAIKSKENKSTEIKLIHLFKKNRITGWRRNFKLYGNPDFVFPKEKIVVFADGCFWHGHSCKKNKPMSNRIYWECKIRRNKKRDSKVNANLRANGWNVFRIWECQIKKEKLPKKIIEIIK
jgi:DNA mismatch endonuclease (patch repair protein)